MNQDDLLPRPSTRLRRMWGRFIEAVWASVDLLVYWIERSTYKQRVLGTLCLCVLFVGIRHQDFTRRLIGVIPQKTAETKTPVFSTYGSTVLMDARQRLILKRLEEQQLDTLSMPTQEFARLRTQVGNELLEALRRQRNLESSRARLLKTACAELGLDLGDDFVVYWEANEKAIPTKLPPQKGVKNPYAPVAASQMKEADAADYIEKYHRTAQAEMEKFGIPASISLAQGLVESRAGQSKLARNNNNHFGIKCFSRRCRKGHCTNATDDHHKDFFRKYQSAWESWRAHSQLLAGSHYSRLKKYGRDYRNWAYGLKALGYATDRTYAEKLIGVIERYDLYKYDQ